MLRPVHYVENRHRHGNGDICLGPAVQHTLFIAKASRRTSGPTSWFIVNRPLTRTPYRITYTVCSMPPRICLRTTKRLVW